MTGFGHRPRSVRTDQGEQALQPRPEACAQKRQKPGLGSPDPHSRLCADSHRSPPRPLGLSLGPGLRWHTASMSAGPGTLPPRPSPPNLGPRASELDLVWAGSSQRWLVRWKGARSASQSPGSTVGVSTRREGAEGPAGRRDTEGGDTPSKGTRGFWEPQEAGRGRRSPTPGPPQGAWPTLCFYTSSPQHEGTSPVA